MKINLLEPNKAEELRSKIKNIWDINRSYWYPLFDCDRQDVIAFHYVDYIYDNYEKLENIRFLLRKHGVKNVYEFQEHGTSNEIIDFLDDEFWCSEPYLGGMNVSSLMIIWTG